MLDKAHAIAINEYSSNITASTKFNLGLVHLNYGFLFRMARKWSISVEHLDKALTHFDMENINYLEALYQKTRCFIEMGNTLTCTDLLAVGTKLSANNEVYLLMFEALAILINPNDESVKNMEANILPYLLKNKLVYPALDYATFLRDYFRTRGRGFKTRSYVMADMVCTIRNLMHEGGVI